MKHWGLVCFLILVSACASLRAVNSGRSYKAYVDGEIPSYIKTRSAETDLIRSVGYDYEETRRAFATFLPYTPALLNRYAREEQGLQPTTLVWEKPFDGAPPQVQN